METLDDEIEKTAAFSVMEHICWEAVENNLDNDSILIIVPKALSLIKQTLSVDGVHKTPKEAAIAALSKLQLYATEYLTQADCIECKHRIRQPKKESVDDIEINMGMFQLQGFEIVCRIFGVVPETSVDMLLAKILPGGTTDLACNYYDPESKDLFERSIAICNMIASHITAMPDQ